MVDHATANQRVEVDAVEGQDEAAVEAIPWRLKVEVTSDVICPFCLIGVKQFLLAVDKVKASHPEYKIDLDIHLLPFQLNSALTETPQSRSTYGIQKFGKERWEMISAQLLERFKAVGVNANMDGQTSSTHLAHRLSTYTYNFSPAKQLPLHMSLFNGFHVEGRHPSDKSWLTSLAVEHEIFPTETEALTFLNSDECDAEVKQGYGNARRLGITGVPFFLFQGKYAANGAAGVEEFVKILEEIMKREKVEAKPPSPHAGTSASG